MNWLNDHGLTVGAASVSYAALLLALLVLVMGFIVASKCCRAGWLMGARAGIVMGIKQPDHARAGA